MRRPGILEPSGTVCPPGETVLELSPPPEAQRVFPVAPEELRMLLPEEGGVDGDPGAGTPPWGRTLTNGLLGWGVPPPQAGSSPGEAASSVFPEFCRSPRVPCSKRPCKPFLKVSKTQIFLWFCKRAVPVPARQRVYARGRNHSYPETCRQVLPFSIRRTPSSVSHWRWARAHTHSHARTHTLAQAHTCTHARPARALSPAPTRPIPRAAGGVAPRAGAEPGLTLTGSGVMGGSPKLP